MNNLPANICLPPRQIMRGLVFGRLRYVDRQICRSCNHKVTAASVCQQLSVMFNLPLFECSGPPTLFLFSSYNWVRCLGHRWKGGETGQNYHTQPTPTTTTTITTATTRRPARTQIDYRYQPKYMSKIYYTDSVIPPYPTLVQNGAAREGGLSMNKHHILLPPTRLLQQRRPAQKTRNTASAIIWKGSTSEESGRDGPHTHFEGTQQFRYRGDRELMFPRQNTIVSCTTTTMQHAKKGLEHMRNDKGLLMQK